MRPTKLKIAVAGLVFGLGMVDIRFATVFHDQIINLSEHSKNTTDTSDYLHSQFDLGALWIIRFGILAVILFAFLACSKPKTVTCLLPRRFIISILGLTICCYSLSNLLTLGDIVNDFRWTNMFHIVTLRVIASILLTLVSIVILFRSSFLESDSNDVDKKVNTAAKKQSTIEKEKLAGSKEGLRNAEENGQATEQGKDATLNMLKLLRLCSSEWRWYLPGVILLILSSAANVFTPYYTGQTMSDVIESKSFETLKSSVALVFGIRLIGVFSSGLRIGTLGQAHCRVNMRIRQLLFESLMKQELGFYDTVRTGDITSRLTSDIQCMSDVITGTLSDFFGTIVVCSGSLLFMLRISWRLTLFSLIAVPMAVIIGRFYGIFHEKLARKAQSSLAKANEVAEEVIGTMRTVKSFANEMGESKHYNEKLVETLTIRGKQNLSGVGFVWCGEVSLVLYNIIEDFI